MPDVQNETRSLETTAFRPTEHLYSAEMQAIEVSPEMIQAGARGLRDMPDAIRHRTADIMTTIYRAMEAERAK